VCRLLLFKQDFGRHDTKGLLFIEWL